MDNREREPREAAPSRRILVIDDAADHLKLFAMFLIDRGHLVETATDPLYALTLVRTFKPDVVFLDLLMPHLQGDQLLPRLKKDAPIARYYVVTARDDDEARRECHSAGCDGFFVKPLDFEIVEKLLEY